MKRRKWDTKAKAMAVIEGLKGKAVSEICEEYQISQSQYYEWRDQFLSCAHQIFESPKQGQREAQLKRENERLKSLVGELSLELKKSDEVLS
ncbi:MAG: transposase [Victivallales bacterium]|nr:transposase [Victivallales bacterium]